MAVEVCAGSVVAHGGSRVGVAGGDLRADARQGASLEEKCCRLRLTRAAMRDPGADSPSGIREVPLAGVLATRPVSA
jgi:hypothetical protein